MPPRRELCRNFQRGSCQYGDRCKFLHAAPQQQKTSPFGFGMQTSDQFQRTTQQQQAPNPFGFGVQSNAHQRGGNDFGSEPNHFKPFENKWTRFSPINSNNSSVSRNQEAQPPPAASHKCTDAESCKRIMIEDLQNEKPLWKLTCYGHKRDGPCDITGDMSSEELRALAYDDAKSGKNLQFIIERERDLLNSKQVQFQNLIQKPSLSSNTTISSQSPFAGNQSNSPFTNSNIPPAVSNFGQLSASLNTKAVATPNYNFGQPTAVQNNAQPHGTNNSLFNSSETTMPHQKSSFGFTSVNSSNSSTTAHQNPFAAAANLSNSTTTAHQTPFAALANSSNSTTTAHQNPFAALAKSSNSTTTAHQIPFSTSVNSSQFGNANGRQMNFPPASLMSDAGAMTNNTTGNKDAKVVDDSIWSKPDWKWNSDEIPEEAPPDNYIF